MERFVVLTTCDSGPPEGPGCCGPLPPRLFLLPPRERAPRRDLNVKSRNISEAGVKLQAGSDVNRAVGYEYFTWTVDEHLQKKKKKTLCIYIFHQAGAKWKSLCLHLEGIPDGGKNPASLSNVPFNNSLPPVISESINSQSKEPTRRTDCVSSPPPPTPPPPPNTCGNNGEQGKNRHYAFTWPRVIPAVSQPGSEEVGKQEPEPGAPHPANSQSRKF